MKYQILNDDGEVVNTIVADVEFVEAHFAGKYRELSEVIVQDPTEYKRQRAAAYPPIGDQLDALFKAGVFPADMAAMIQAVKAKYPKPE